MAQLQTKDLIITNVYHFTNGMVMVFDQYGQQMPEYQGKYEEVIGKIREKFKDEIIIWLF